MNDYDKSNLNFLLNASDEILLDWYNTVGEDDHEYASELLSQYKEELAIKQRFYNVEDFDLPEECMLPDAKKYLSKFRL